MDEVTNTGAAVSEETVTATAQTAEESETGAASAGSGLPERRADGMRGEADPPGTPGGRIPSDAEKPADGEGDAAPASPQSTEPEKAQTEEESEPPSISLSVGGEEKTYTPEEAAPLVENGLKWQAFLAFCASAISKESLLGVLNTLYGAGGSLVSSIFGAKVSAAAAGGISEILAANFTKAEGLAFIFAISFNMPCVSALAATAREAHSVRWTAKIGVFYTLASLLIACIVYHIGVLLF